MKLPLCSDFDHHLQSVTSKFRKAMDMDISRLKTDRLILRNFEEKDMEALYLLLKDKEVNTFLPWLPVKTLEETKSFFETRLKDQKYSFAICLQENDDPIGYVKAGMDDSYDFGYVSIKF